MFDGHTLLFSTLIGAIWFALALFVERRDPWQQKLKTAAVIGVIFFVFSVITIRYAPQNTDCFEYTPTGSGRC